jgi:DNA repair protein RecN (Recombination protein N)
LEELEGRLTAIGDLKRKYGRTIEEVIGHGERITDKAAELEGLLADADRIDAEVADASRTVAACAADLSKARTRAAEIISAEMRRHLADLGLSGAKVEIELEPVDPGPTGADRVVIRFASDPRLETRPIADAASGGELSRLVLAIRLATKSKSTATLVFDEVDTGIGGKTALAMGAKLADLARDRQVLCVTHLAQVAAHADTHYVVEKDSGGVAHVRHVIGDDRVTEIARMLAGQPDSLATKTAAAELLATVL